MSNSRDYFLIPIISCIVLILSLIINFSYVIENLPSSILSVVDLVLFTFLDYRSIFSYLIWFLAGLAATFLYKKTSPVTKGIAYSIVILWFFFMINKILLGPLEIPDSFEEKMELLLLIIEIIPIGMVSGLAVFIIGVKIENIHISKKVKKQKEIEFKGTTCPNCKTDEYLTDDI